MAVWLLGGPFFNLQARFWTFGDQTSPHYRRAKCIIGHMRPALFLVHFYSKFMVLILKRLKIRVIASNLQNRAKKCHFWTFALNEMTNLTVYGYFSVFFLPFSVKYIAPTLIEIKEMPLETTSGVQKSHF